MKKIILIKLFFIFSIKVFSQQQPLYSQYMLNSFLINPALAGTDETSPLKLTLRQQWLGIEDAPSTQALSYHTTIKNLDNCGLGTFLYRDRFGPVSQTGLHGVFSYHLKISSNTNLSFGLSMSGFQYVIDETGLNIINPDDPSIIGKKETCWVPDANTGLYLKNPLFYIGISSTQLIQKKFDSQTLNMGQMVRHYYLTSGYNWVLNDDYILIPSVLFKGTDYTPLQIDLNAQLFYKKSISLAFSYRHKDASVVMLGLKKDRFLFGYAFDYTLRNLSTFNHGSHELDWV